LPSLLRFSARLFRAAFGRFFFLLYPAFSLPPLDGTHSEDFPAFAPFSRGVRISDVKKCGGIAEI
jgi:hypothetical protein